MTAPLHRSRRSATGCTGDVCGPGRVLVLPVTPEITASFAAAAEAAPAPPAALADEQALPGGEPERQLTPVERPRVDNPGRPCRARVARYHRWHGRGGTDGVTGCCTG